MNRSTVWKIVKKFQEAGNTFDRLGRGRKWSIRSPQSLKNTREKLRQTLYRTLATAADVSKSTMHRVLKGNLEVKLFKMLHRQELTANHVVLRAQKCREILQEDGRLHATESRVHGQEEI